MPERSPEKWVDAFYKNEIKGDGPGAAVLAARNGSILFREGYGFADVERRVPITPKTKFRIASITKQFTSAAILKLQEEGELGVDDSLSHHIPDFARGDEVTIHHLLTHTSGIYNYTGDPLFDPSGDGKIEDFIESLKKRPLAFDPGKKVSYANSNSVLLGHIIEKVSGGTYGDFLQRVFFGPIGMADTGVHSPDLKLNHEALGYRFEGDGFHRAIDWNLSQIGAAGALYSTVDDLHRWNEAVFNGRVLNDASLKAALTPVKTAEISQAEFGTGYGWGLRQTHGLDEAFIGGGIDGFSCFLARFPKGNFTFVVMRNENPARPGVDTVRLADEAMKAFLGDKMSFAEAESDQE